MYDSSATLLVGWLYWFQKEPLPSYYLMISSSANGLSNRLPFDDCDPWFPRRPTAVLLQVNLSPPGMPNTLQVSSIPSALMCGRPSALVMSKSLLNILSKKLFWAISSFILFIIINLCHLSSHFKWDVRLYIAHLDKLLVSLEL